MSEQDGYLRIVAPIPFDVLTAIGEAVARRYPDARVVSDPEWEGFVVIRLGAPDPDVE